MKKLFLLIAFITSSCSPAETNQDLKRWESFANNVSITRDNWGIAHIYGKTDADTVFGMIYAQAEDDFPRIEENYLNSMGRLAETEGISEIYRDLRMKLFIRPDEIKELYFESPKWLRTLMNAWADGLNYYLYTHPETKPRVLTHFEPWMALTFTEGSIGGDIERVSLSGLENFYGNGMNDLYHDENLDPKEPQGSNGFAISPQNTQNGNALLWINPHTSFYFRSELHMVSEEGLNAYGASTWGQFFVYQGFNEKNGWMHTSSGADFIDEYLETIIEKDDGYYYQYGNEQRKLETTEITLPYITDGGMAEKIVTVYNSHHGPIIRAIDDKWVAIALMQNPIKALIQSYQRTKTTGYESYKTTMENHTNSSNNTVYADADGNIAYFHSNFIPRRDESFDWNHPVDGSNPQTEWRGLHSTDETVGILNPKNGWIQNTNNWPFSVSGDLSPKQSDFPSYMSTYPENYRGLNAIRVLDGKTDFTMDSLIEAAYTPYLNAFEDLLPALIAAYDGLPEGNSLKGEVSEKIEALRAWDYNTSINSIPTSLAIYWATQMNTEFWEIGQEAGIGRRDGIGFNHFISLNTSPLEKLTALQDASQKLKGDFGTWKTPWGNINRFQRITGDIYQPFNDDAASTAVGFASARWGSLAAFGERMKKITTPKKIFGTGGNSFVAVVEFGARVKAKAITAGGLSNNMGSPHFNDQIEGYATGTLRDVYYYPEDVETNAERTYKPGQN
ncbi:MAG: penicillin acylase family protein [Sphingomonadales bacterium]